jgi:hypothetical protein
MSSKIIYERIFWFHNRIKDDRFPNTRALSEQFGVSRKTAQRDIEFMRDRLGFPLRYVPDSRGYAYEDNTWELPGLWLNEDELVSLVLSYRLASAVPDASVKTALRTFLNDVIARHACADFNIDESAKKSPSRTSPMPGRANLFFTGCWKPCSGPDRSGSNTTLPTTTGRASAISCLCTCSTTWEPGTLLPIVTSKKNCGTLSCRA